MGIINLIEDEKKSEEEKISELHELAAQLKEKKQKESNEVRKKYENQAKETKLRIDNHNNNARIEELINVLCFMKGKTGDYLYKKEELNKFDNWEIMEMYNKAKELNPGQVKEAWQELYDEREKKQKEENNNIDKTQENTSKEEKKPESKESKLSNIANNLGVEVSELTSIANNKQNKTQNNKNETDNNQQPSKEDVENFQNNQLKPDEEGRKKVSKLHKAGDWLKKRINITAGKAAIAIGAGIVALGIIFGPIGVLGATGVGAGLVVKNEINKGRKGR